MLRWVPVLLCCAGCSTTATIVTRDGIDEARIVGGDQHHLVLENDIGYQRVVRRTSVKDIDHPGNVHALLGGIGTAVMGLEMGFFGAFCGRASPGMGGCTEMLVAFGALGAAALGEFVWGLWTWLNSTRMVSESVNSPPLPGVPVPAELPLVPAPGL